MTDVDVSWLLIGDAAGMASALVVILGFLLLARPWSLARRVCCCDDYAPHFHHDGRRWFG